MKLVDYEYGYRNIESMWTTYDHAENQIEKLGQQIIEMWSGKKEKLYTIWSYTIEE